MTLLGVYFHVGCSQGRDIKTAVAGREHHMNITVEREKKANKVSDS